MDEAAGPVLRHGMGNAFGRFHMKRSESLPAGLRQNADQVDRDIGARHGRVDIVIAGDVAFEKLNLADPAHGFQKMGCVGVPDGDADAPTGLGKGADDVPADEAGAAENDGKTGAGNGRGGHAVAIQCDRARFLAHPARNARAAAEAACRPAGLPVHCIARLHAHVRVDRIRGRVLFANENQLPCGTPVDVA